MSDYLSGQINFILINYLKIHWGITVTTVKSDITFLFMILVNQINVLTLKRNSAFVAYGSMLVNILFSCKAWFTFSWVHLRVMVPERL